MTYVNAGAEDGAHILSYYGSCLGPWGLELEAFIPCAGMTALLLILAMQSALLLQGHPCGSFWQWCCYVGIGQPCARCWDSVIGLTKHIHAFSATYPRGVFALCPIIALLMVGPGTCSIMMHGSLKFFDARR